MFINLTCQKFKTNKKSIPFSCLPNFKCCCTIVTLLSPIVPHLPKKNKHIYCIDLSYQYTNLIKLFANNNNILLLQNSMNIKFNHNHRIKKYIKPIS